MEGSAWSLALLLIGCRSKQPASSPPPAPQPGAPVESPTSRAAAPAGREVVLGGLLEVPRGFRAVVLQRQGDRMTDGYRVAAQPDGMTCHGLPDGRWVLLRNHELGEPAFLERAGIPHAWFAGDRRPPESFGSRTNGGVSRVVLDPAALRRALHGDGLPATAVLSSNAVLVGTDRNCAGGPVELGSLRGWVTCEESDDPGHGWAFLTRVDDEAVVDPASRKLTSWGRFKREAVAIDPASGIAWMTEDDEDGLFYRHVPHDPKDPLGPGRLEALRVPGLSHTDPRREHDRATPLTIGRPRAVEWVEIEDPAAEATKCRDQGRRHGATRFNRGEGMARDPQTGAIYFIASTAGPVEAGQIFRYDPEQNTLTLATQVEDRGVLSMPDNVTVAPWGDLVMAEDNYDRRGARSQYVRGMTPDGRVYDILRNAHDTLPGEPPDPGIIRDLPPGAEFAGCCFSPDGEVLFVNLQSPENVTLAIAGDWAELSRAPSV